MPVKICYWRNRAPDPNLPGAVTEAQSAPRARGDTQQGESTEGLSRAPSRLKESYHWTYYGMIRRTTDGKRDGSRLFWRNRHEKREG